MPTIGNQLLTDGVWDYTYDLENNLIEKNKAGADIEKWVYGYDHRNQLISADHFDSSNVLVMEADYKYDVFGNRVEKAVDADGVGTTFSTETSRFAVDGWNPAKTGGVGTENVDVFADLNGSNGLTTRYFRGDKIDELLARMAGTASRWYLADHLGSIRDVIDDTGVVGRKENGSHCLSLDFPPFTCRQEPGCRKSFSRFHGFRIIQLDNEYLRIILCEEWGLAPHPFRRMGFWSHKQKHVLG